MLSSQETLSSIIQLHVSRLFFREMLEPLNLSSHLTFRLMSKQGKTVNQSRKDSSLNSSQTISTVVKKSISVKCNCSSFLKSLKRFRLDWMNLIIDLTDFALKI